MDNSILVPSWHLTAEGPRQERSMVTDSVRTVEGVFWGHPGERGVLLR